MKRTVLVIDGNKAMRFLMQTVLGKEFQVVTASDANAALFWLSKKNTPDLMIIDPQLEEGEDWELVEYLSDSGMYGDIPKIILTALDKNLVMFKCAELNIEHFAFKPFNPIDFVKLVNAVADGKQLQSAYGLTAV